MDNEDKIKRIESVRAMENRLDEHCHEMIIGFSTELTSDKYSCDSKIHRPFGGISDCTKCIFNAHSTGHSLPSIVELSKELWNES